MAAAPCSPAEMLCLSSIEQPVRERPRHAAGFEHFADPDDDRVVDPGMLVNVTFNGKWREFSPVGVKRPCNLAAYF